LVMSRLYTPFIFTQMEVFEASFVMLSVNASRSLTLVRFVHNNWQAAVAFAEILSQTTILRHI